MSKLFNKKLNKKGFTLAELLVVIAILAILIAIAIPVFSKMVAEANLRVNQANVHSVRSAAVTKILTSLDKIDDKRGSTTLYSEGLKTNKGWVALAEVDNAGDITNLKVYVVDIVANYGDGIHPKSGLKFENVGGKADRGNDFYAMPATLDTTCKFATVKPTTSPSNRYTVQAVITDLGLERNAD